jgi:energy-coupling factor transport system ATP-binding protein
MIQAKNLCYTYDSDSKNPEKAVENINLSVDNGEILGIIGKTGSGKSTLVQMLSGLLKPTSGKVLLNGKDINTDFKNIREVYFKIGMVFQYPEQQLFGSTVFEDIAFGLRNKGTPENKITDCVLKAAEFTGLDQNLLNRSPLELSGGEKRRCAISGVMAMEPEVLILDEPTSGLDAKGEKNLINSILRYHEKEKGIIIFISHVMEEIAQITDKVLVMDKGRQIFLDTTENVFQNTEKLQSMGLDAPQTARIISLINEKGYNINKKTITPQKSQQNIIKLLRSGGV